MQKNSPACTSCFKESAFLLGSREKLCANVLSVFALPHVTGHSSEHVGSDGCDKTMSAPDRTQIPFEFVYTPSQNGPSTNLLILLHGLGDTHVRFHKLGRDLNLPQTATLALCAPLPYIFCSPPSQNEQTYT